MVKKGDRVPFYWANKNKDKLVCMKQVSECLSPLKKQTQEFEWSCGFPISELGIISIECNQRVSEHSKKDSKKDIKQLFSKERNRKKFFKIDRRLHSNTIFVVISEENSEQPTYRIENLSSHFAIRIQQVEEFYSSEICNIQEKLPYTWTNYMGIHELQVEFFFGDITQQTFFIQGFYQRFALDQLNIKQVIKVPVSYNEHIELFA